MTVTRGGNRHVVLPPLGFDGVLGLPAARARGLVLFAHGSGSGRFSPRNTHVAKALREQGFATLLFDLLSVEESADRTNTFDIGLLAGRLVAATEWAGTDDAVAGLPILYFGASTGAAAALVAAARLGDTVAAIVSRGGRPDLAGDALSRVRSPTLLIVGSADVEVLELNHAARARMICRCELEVVHGATHLFEEPGALDQVVALAGGWFLENTPAD